MGRSRATLQQEGPTMKTVWEEHGHPPGMYGGVCLCPCRMLAHVGMHAQHLARGEVGARAAGPVGQRRAYGELVTLLRVRITACPNAPPGRKYPAGLCQPSWDLPAGSRLQADREREREKREGGRECEERRYLSPGRVLGCAAPIRRRRICLEMCESAHECVRTRVNLSVCYSRVS